MQSLAKTAGNETKTKYFDCIMQTSQEDKIRSVTMLFTTEKKEACKKKSPVTSAFWNKTNTEQI